MATATDPVCGMTVHSETAAGKSKYGERVYYFCSVDCKEQFDSDPARYAAKQATPGVADVPERHEPPRTTTGGITAPKFGSAGSGGAEYERLPEAHDRDDN